MSRIAPLWNVGIAVVERDFMPPYEEDRIRDFLPRISSAVEIRGVPMASLLSPTQRFSALHGSNVCLLTRIPINSPGTSAHCLVLARGVPALGCAFVSRCRYHATTRIPRNLTRGLLQKMPDLGECI